MVKLRMRRTGCTNHAPYRIVAADSRSPRDGKFLEILGWYDTQIKDNCLTVTLSRGVLKRISSWFEPTSYELVKDWSRIANSRANRTITVRRTKH